jgi:hypothetical protein
MLNMRLPVAEKCFVDVYGDIGGFGVESDLTWMVMGAAGYSISESIDLLVAYQHLDADYENGDFVYDAATSGFAVGVSFAL